MNNTRVLIENALEQLFTTYHSLFIIHCDVSRTFGGVVHLNVIVNYPNKDDTAAMLELDRNVARFNAILIKEKIEQLNIDNAGKRKVFDEVINYFKSD